MTGELRKPRPRRSLRRALTLLVALELLVVGAVSVASAAQLGVSSSAIGVFSETRCSSATLSVHVNPTGTTYFWQYNKTAVRIVNYPSGCDGQTVEVTVSNSSGTALASGSATCSAPACTITTSSYDATLAANASILVATWGVPASWDSVCTVGGFLSNRMTCT